jgi:membrane protease YdiL (CAAX protease family)
MLGPPMRTALRESLIVYAGVAAATFAITRLRAFPAAADYVHLLVAALFLVTAIRLAQREEQGLVRYGIALSGLLGPTGDEKDDRPGGPLGILELFRAIRAALRPAAREGLAALGVIAAVFPAFAAAFYVWHRPEQPFGLDLREDFLSFAAAQLVVVALPEEALFRGYFQTRLGDAWPDEIRILGVAVPWKAWLLQAALFAVIHFVVDLDPQRLAVFFPGLLFGWIRAWRGGMGAAMAVHAASNIWSEILLSGWVS